MSEIIVPLILLGSNLWAYYKYGRRTDSAFFVGFATCWVALTLFKWLREGLPPWNWPGIWPFALGVLVATTIIYFLKKKTTMT